MNRESEIKVMSIALVMLQEADKLRAQDTYAPTADLPWRTFDALADAFREGGVETFTDHLGAQVHCRVCSKFLDPDKGERFIGDDGNAYCNDHYEGDLSDAELDADEALVAARVEDQEHAELDRKLRERPRETSALMDELAARFPDRVTQFAEPEEDRDA